MRFNYAFKVWILTQVIGIAAYLLLGISKELSYLSSQLLFYLAIGIGVVSLAAIPTLLIFYFSGMQIAKLGLPPFLIKAIMFFILTCCIVLTNYICFGKEALSFDNKWPMPYYIMGASLSCFLIPLRIHPRKNEMEALLLSLDAPEEESQVLKS